MDLEEFRGFIHPDDKIAFACIVARAWVARDGKRRDERQWSRDMNRRFDALDASPRPKPSSDRMAVGE